jgi:hypothetical protein
MRADVYQKLYEFNLHIDRGVAALREMAQVKKASAGEVLRYAEYLEENRTAASGYLTSIVSDQEEREAGRLFSKRRRREMAEDPMHGGWLEEEREKKRLAGLRKARRSQKKNRSSVK